MRCYFRAANIHITISGGYMSDNAVAKSLKEKSKVEVINSAEAKWLNRKGILVAKFDFYRKQIYIDIFVNPFS